MHPAGERFAQWAGMLELRHDVGTQSTGAEIAEVPDDHRQLMKARA
jgi:hypothetical protein